MDKDHDFDAIVIGAGVIGGAVALALSRQGQQVLVLDKGREPGHGSTAGSCAIIRPYYSTVEGCALAYESHFRWKDWPTFLGTTDERGFARYVDCGCIVMKTAANGHLLKVKALMDEIGCPYEDLDAEALQAAAPWLTLDRYGPPVGRDDPTFGQPTGGVLEGAVRFPTGGYVTDPALSAHNLMRAAEAAGATFRFGEEVTDICMAGGTRAVEGVRTNGNPETIRAPVVVNVAGPHAAHLNEMAGVADEMNVSTRALRHEVAHVPLPPQSAFALRPTVFSDSDAGVYMRPEGEGHLLIGSEDPDCDPREWVDDPDAFERGFTDHWTTLVMRAAQRMPDLAIPNAAKGVVELYDVSDDWLPIYDRSGLKGYYMACGTSGNQFKNAPVVGEMMAELIDWCERGHDHDADPVQFRLERLDRTISLGAYSRLRTPNPDSSMSVLG